MNSFKSVQNVQCTCRQFKCGLREQIWCSMFKVDRCSMYPGSLPLISNGSVPAHEKLFNVRRCSMYTGVQFGRFHCSSIIIINISHIITGNLVLITILHPSSSSSSSSFLKFVFVISYHVYGQYCTFNSCTSRPDICQCLVVQIKKPSTLMTRVSCKSKICSVVRSSIHP